MERTFSVRDVRWHSEGIFELQVVREGYTFVPGDCVALFAEDGATSRPYSIASGTDEEILRFVIRRMPGGQVSPYLAMLRPGDLVKGSAPFGWFRPGLRKDGFPYVFVATGTGISPFLSQLRSRPDQAPMLCLYGVRTLADAVEREWLRGRCPLRLAVSREVTPEAHHGRVTDLLGEMPCGAGLHYYVCGLDSMIDEVSRWLEARQVPLTQIHRECFFNASYSA